MRTLFCILLYVLCSFCVKGQLLSGDWEGMMGPVHLNLYLSWQSDDKSYVVRMESPDQYELAIPVDSLVTTPDSIICIARKAHSVLRGRIDYNGKISGIVLQSGHTYPFFLYRQGSPAYAIYRPQHPLPPYPYREENILFTNTDTSITYSGTLTLPEKGDTFPAVLLISGSGPQDRNELIAGHKIFLVLADYLTRQGIAVLRVDDRGTAGTTGEYVMSSISNFADDAAAAVRYLKTRKEINPAQIGLIGHSEGAMVAPLVIIRTNSIAFLVMLAGPGVDGEDLAVQQLKMQLRSIGVSNNNISAYVPLFRTMLRTAMHNDSTGLYQLQARTFSEWRKQQLPSALTALRLDAPSQQALLLKSMSRGLFINPKRSLVQSDNPTALMQVKCPVLALNGSKDLQVSSKENLAGIQAALERGGNKAVTTCELPDLNHLFQHAQTGAFSEYANISETFSPETLKIISDWILQQTVQRFTTAAQ
ncbi:MAG TPA: alpha/beta hydrolase [Chitinophaga sp.]|uniref:alpha/beta hydrolase family protein n=1 Tax=Chitinophaga sp. TaxID=1869181 RepID=UPI002BDAA6AC|nr:alpha/beta hydrolase [Chitinophaga sp.]HVI48864.1 alpha/beta hydrolase [Chitinophaga sp.]